MDRDTTYRLLNVIRSAVADADGSHIAMCSWQTCAFGTALRLQPNLAMALGYDLTAEGRLIKAGREARYEDIAGDLGITVGEAGYLFCPATYPEHLHYGVPAHAEALSRLDLVIRLYRWSSGLPELRVVPVKAI